MRQLYETYNSKTLLHFGTDHSKKHKILLHIGNLFNSIIATVTLRYPRNFTKQDVTNTSQHKDTEVPLTEIEVQYENLWQMFCQLKSSSKITKDRWIHMMVLFEGRNMIKRLHTFLNENPSIYHGYLTDAEAMEKISGEKSGSYLVRYSPSQTGTPLGKTGELPLVYMTPLGKIGALSLVYMTPLGKRRKEEIEVSQGKYVYEKTEFGTIEELIQKTNLASRCLHPIRSARFARVRRECENVYTRKDVVN